MEKLSLEKLPLWLNSSFRYFEKHERHITRYFYTTDVLVMVFEGVLRFEEDGQPVEIRAGEYYIQKHGHTQSGNRESDSPKYFWIHFTEAEYDDRMGSLPLRGHADFSELFPLLREMDTSRMIGEPLVKISAIFYSILGRLQEKNELRNSNEVVNRVISAVMEDIRKPFSLDAVAEKCGYSKNHVISIFKRATGKTPLVFFNDMKIEMAQQLMLNSDSSLSGISAECGFGSYINLYRCFTKAVGCSPAEWKKQHRILPKSK